MLVFIKKYYHKYLPKQIEEKMYILTLINLDKANLINLFKT